MSTTEEHTDAAAAAEAAVSTPATADRPAPPGRKPPYRTGPGAGLVALARRWWRQLTSMRTALILLFLLAIAAIPGSLLPQRNLNIEKVGAYLADHPELGPWLDRFFLFDVYSSPWFSAIYLLLFTSLIGCLVPRLRDHLRALRRVPPDAPRRLERLPVHAAASPYDGDVAATADHLRGVLKARRFRTVLRTHDDGSVTVSAEKGYLKESGNLLFHFSLMALLLGVALGSWFGWHANRLVVAGAEQAFCNSLQQYDDYGLGARVSPSDLPPFCIELKDFRASYLDNGQATSFTADISYTQGGAAAKERSVSVNHPLRLSDATVYLLGHGYAPVVRYTDRYGQSQTSVSPFLTRDAMLTSDGVVAFPDANVDPNTGIRDGKSQVAFRGVYLPTVPDDPSHGSSLHPEERDPRLMLVAFRGNLGLDAGIAQSVYTLDERQIATGKLNQVGDPHMMKIGDTWTLDDGSKVEFLGTRPFATMSVRYDPGERYVLAAAVFLLTGLLLSLTGRRRRVWFRVRPEQGRSLVEAGALARNEYTGFAAEFDSIVAAAGTQQKRGTDGPPV